MHVSKFILFTILPAFMLVCSSWTSVFSDNNSESKWDELLKREPFIYTVPKINKKTSIDGVYVKKALKEGEMVPCRRCPDWLANPGIWRIYFNKGAYMIINTNTGWKSIGTYIVSKDRVILSNDPSCIDDFGLYRFLIKGGVLKFEVIDDPCAIKLRGLNLGETSWFSCYPPNEEAAITEHWPKPVGCR